MSQTAVSESALNLLAEVELHYVEDKPAVSPDGKVGVYIGSGVGTVSGPELAGSVHWTLFEDQHGETCESNLFGTITTGDGALIRFDTMGLFRRPYADQPHLWVSSAAVQFATDDARFAWLNPLLAVWEGTFDMKAYRHHYRLYLPARP